MLLLFENTVFSGCDVTLSKEVTMKLSGWASTMRLS